jgi:hypothetical protein
MERVSNFKELWFSIIFKTPKKCILIITLILLAIGYAMDFLTRNFGFLERPLSFYPGFMDFLGTFFAGVTYLFTMIIGVFIYGDINYLIHDKNCGPMNKFLNVFVRFVNYLLSYILPLIIIVSLISSSANSMSNEGTNNCPGDLGIQLDSNITNFIFLIFTILLIATYVVFSHLKCQELGTFSQATSFLFTFFVLFGIIIGNLILVYFTIQNYTNYLTDLYNAEEQWGYWVLFGISILIYIIQTFRGVNSKNLIENLFDKLLKGVFTVCSNSKDVLFNIGEVRDKQRAKEFGYDNEKDFKDYRKKQVRGDKGSVFGISPSKFGKTMFYGLKPDERDIKMKNKSARNVARVKKEMGRNKLIPQFIKNLKSLPEKNKQFKIPPEEKIGQLNKI